MTVVEPSPASTGSGYQLEGTLLEVCSCETLCPCWIGEDPDYGTCQSVVAYNLTKGTIRGVDVSGLTLVSAVNIPGNILEGNWRQLVLIDERRARSTARQRGLAFMGTVGEGTPGGRPASCEKIRVPRTERAHSAGEECKCLVCRPSLGPRLARRLGASFSSPEDPAITGVAEFYHADRGRQLAAGGRCDVSPEPDGALFGAEPLRRAAAAEMQRSMGVEVDLLTAEEARGLIPGLAVEDVVGATFGPGDGIADPSGLTEGYAAAARRAAAFLRNEYRRIAAIFAGKIWSPEAAQSARPFTGQAGSTTPEERILWA